MEEIEKIANVTISKTTTGYNITGFTNTNMNIMPFIEEMKNMRGELNKSAEEFTIDNVGIKRLISCVNAHYGKGKNISIGQRSWKEKIIEFFGNEEIIFKKDDQGIFIIDPMQISGTTNEIKGDLESMGIKTIKVVNKKRIYLDIPIFSASPTKKRKLKKKIKKIITVDTNEKFVMGDIIKYIGEHFDGFSKFNPNAKFVKYEDNKCVISYKNKEIVTSLKNIIKR